MLTRARNGPNEARMREPLEPRAKAQGERRRGVRPPFVEPELVCRGRLNVMAEGGKKQVFSPTFDDHEYDVGD
jgi:hypothetical protein